MNRYEFIGRKIKNAREEAGLPQRELAVLLDYDSVTAISLIEAGERKVSIEDLEKIADKLHKDIKFFLGQDEPDLGKPNLKFALRADKEITPKDADKILSFIDFVKQENERRRGN